MYVHVFANGERRWTAPIDELCLRYSPMIEFKACDLTLDTFDGDNEWAADNPKSFAGMICDLSDRRRRELIDRLKYTYDATWANQFMWFPIVFKAFDGFADTLERRASLRPGTKMAYDGHIRGTVIISRRFYESVRFCQQQDGKELDVAKQGGKHVYEYIKCGGLRFDSDVKEELGDPLTSPSAPPKSRTPSPPRIE